MLKRESYTTTPSLANQDRNTDLEDKQPGATRDTDKEGNQHVTLKKEPCKTGRDISNRLSHSETITVQGDDANTPKSEKVNPQGYLRAPPRLTGLSRIWSVCPIVTFVCSVCLALSIHAHREEVSTIIDFMMVPSSLIP